MQLEAKYNSEDLNRYCNGLKEFNGEEVRVSSKKNNKHKKLSLGDATAKLVRIWGTLPQKEKRLLELSEVLENKFIKANSKNYQTIKGLLTCSNPIPISKKLVQIHHDYLGPSSSQGASYIFPGGYEECSEEVLNFFHILDIGLIKRGTWIKDIEYEIRPSSVSGAVTVILENKKHSASFRFYPKGEIVEVKRLYNRDNQSVEGDVLITIPLEEINLEIILLTVYKLRNVKLESYSTSEGAFTVAVPINLRPRSMSENASRPNLVAKFKLATKTRRIRYEGYECLIRKSSEEGALTVLVIKGGEKGSYRLYLKDNQVTMNPLFYNKVKVIEQISFAEITIDWIVKKAIEHIVLFQDSSLAVMPLLKKLGLDDLTQDEIINDEYTFRIRKSRTEDAVSFIIERLQKNNSTLTLEKRNVILSSDSGKEKIPFKDLTEGWVILNAIKQCPFTKEMGDSLEKITFPFDKEFYPGDLIDARALPLLSKLKLNQLYSRKLTKNIFCVLKPFNNDSVKISVHSMQYACLRLRVKDDRVYAYPLINEYMEGDSVVDFPLSTDKDELMEIILKHANFNK